MSRITLAQRRKARWLERTRPQYDDRIPVRTMTEDRKVRWELWSPEKLHEACKQNFMPDGRLYDYCSKYYGDPYTKPIKESK